MDTSEAVVIDSVLMSNNFKFKFYIPKDNKHLECCQGEKDHVRAFGLSCDNKVINNLEVFVLENQNNISH